MAKVARVLHMCDDDTRAGKPPHRVSAYMVGTDPGTLRAEFVAYVTDRTMARNLRRELVAYALCQLDDTWIEAPHRDQTRLSARAPASSAALRSARWRLDQNLHGYDSFGHSWRQRVLESLYTWKTILNDPTRPKYARRPKRIKSTAAFEMLYRSGAESNRDWGQLKRIMDASLPKPPRAKRRAALRLKIEYMAAALKEGVIFTLPCPTEAALAAASDLPIGQAALALEDQQRAEPLAFKVVDLSVKDKKVVSTARAKEVKGSALPVSLQYCGWWRLGAYPAGSDGVSHEVYLDGYPSVVDVVALAEWPVLRAGLRSWATGPSDVQGCSTMHSPKLVAHELDDMWPLNTPTLSVLDRLRETGWMVGPQPQAHVRGGERIFSVNDASRQKWYLQRLALLDDMLGRWAMPCLRTDQPNKYYACLLLAASPRDVPLGLASKAYGHRLQALLENTEGAREAVAEFDALLDEVHWPLTTRSWMARPSKRHSGL